MRPISYSVVETLKPIISRLSSVIRPSGRQGSIDRKLQIDIVNSFGFDRTNKVRLFSKILELYRDRVVSLDITKRIDEDIYGRAHKEARFINSSRYWRELVSISEKNASSIYKCVYGYHFDRYERAFANDKIYSALSRFVVGRYANSFQLMDIHYSNVRDRYKIVSRNLSLISNLIYLAHLSEGFDNSVQRASNADINSFRELYISKLCSLLSIEVAGRREIDIPAYLLSYKDDRHIFLNSKLNGYQSGFAVLHEMAHVVLDHDKVPSVIETKEQLEKDNDQEYACDQFALTMFGVIEGLYLLYGGRTENRDLSAGMYEMVRCSSVIQRCAEQSCDLLSSKELFGLNGVERTQREQRPIQSLESV